MDYGMNRLVSVLVTALIAVVIIGAVVIPIVIEEQDPGDVKPGEEWSHSFSINLPEKEATASISGGTGQQYCTVERVGENFVVKGTFPENDTYTVEVTVKTSYPTQYASKTFSVYVQDSSNFALLLVIPTFLIIGVILYIINYLGIIDISSAGSYLRNKGGDGPSDSINEEWADR